MEQGYKLKSSAYKLLLFICEKKRINKLHQGAWVVQSVKCLTLGRGSGHDLTIHGFEPYKGLCTGSVETAWDSLSLSFSLCPFPTHAVPVSLKINK